MFSARNAYLGANVANAGRSPLRSPASLNERLCRLASSRVALLFILCSGKENSALVGPFRASGGSVTFVLTVSVLFEHRVGAVDGRLFGMVACAVRAGDRPRRR